MADLMFARDITIRWLAVGVFLLLLACGSKREQGSQATATATATATVAANPVAVLYSCDERAKLSNCSESSLTSKYMRTLGQDMAREVCVATGGTWQATTCSTEKLVATCVDTQGSRHFYYSDGARAFSLEEAKRACTGGDKPGIFKSLTPAVSAE